MEQPMSRTLQPIPASLQPSINPGLLALVRMAVQDAIREEVEEMAAVARGEALPTDLSEVQS
jgi:hypothetical protein